MEAGLPKTCRYAPWEAMLLSMTDGMTIYYIVYLGICLLALVTEESYWLPFLLLDIVVKNSTCRNVLNAVMLPYKQLGMTLVLGLFVTYIYAYIYYTYFLGDAFFGMGLIRAPKNLFSFFIISWGWGLRAGGGNGDWFRHNINGRWMLDLSYFIIVNVILLNIIFGIIIDKFAELRNQKDARTDDIENRCFICGQTKETFDRALNGGFAKHITKKAGGEHHMWHYFYFIVFIWEQVRLLAFACNSGFVAIYVILSYYRTKMMMMVLSTQSGI